MWLRVLEGIIMKSVRRSVVKGVRMYYKGEC